MCSKIQIDHNVNIFDNGTHSIGHLQEMYVENVME